MSRQPDPVNPHASPLALFGAALRHWRELSGPLTKVAAEALVDPTNLSRWERGERRPPADAVARLDQVLHAGGFLVALHARVVGNMSVQSSPAPSSGSDAYDMDKVRRQILQSLAALGLALPLHGIDGLRHAATATAGGDHIGDWEDTAWQYAHMLAAKPPAAVLADFMVDTLELQQVIQRNDGRAEPAWQRVAAQFGFLMAQCLGFMGEARESRHWWAVARRAADLSGDIDLRAAVRGYAAMQSLYLGHPRPVVQRQADDALAIAAGRACAGTAEAQSVRALLAALAGDAGRATIALHNLEDMFDRMPDRVTSDTETGFGWPRTRLLHSQSFVLARVGPADAAVAAHTAAIAAYPAWRSRQIVQVRLHQAVTAVRHGDITDGVAHAATALQTLPAEQRTIFVRTAATDVLHTVPISEAKRPAVAEYRELLALPPAQ